MGEISTVERGRDGRDVEGAKGWGVLLVWRTTLMSQYTTFQFSEQRESNPLRNTICERPHLKFLNS